MLPLEPARLCGPEELAVSFTMATKATLMFTRRAYTIMNPRDPITDKT